MNFVLIEGVVSNLERTTQVRGGGKTPASTTQIALFSIGDERVILKSKSPAMILDGDHLKLSGIRNNGEFNAVACKNMTTGWTTTSKKQSGCASVILFLFILIGLWMAWLSPIFFIFPVFGVFMLFVNNKEVSNDKRAHDLIQ